MVSVSKEPRTAPAWFPPLMAAAARPRRLSGRNKSRDSRAGPLGSTQRGRGGAPQGRHCLPDGLTSEVTATALTEASTRGEGSPKAAPEYQQSGLAASGNTDSKRREQRGCDEGPRHPVTRGGRREERVSTSSAGFRPSRARRLVQGGSRSSCRSRGAMTRGGGDVQRGPLFGLHGAPVFRGPRWDKGWGACQPAEGPGGAQWSWHAAHGGGRRAPFEKDFEIWVRSGIALGWAANRAAWSRVSREARWRPSSAMKSASAGCKAVPSRGGAATCQRLLALPALTRTASSPGVAGDSPIQGFGANVPSAQAIAFAGGGAKPKPKPRPPPLSAADPRAANGASAAWRDLAPNIACARAARLEPKRTSLLESHPPKPGP